MKLKEFNFNEIGTNHIAIRMENGPWYEKLTIAETLSSLPPHFAEAKIKTTRYYFDTYVIELST